MRLADIEAWALKIESRITEGAGVEDDRVEVKREFPDPKRAARRLAGQANAAGSEYVLWIIGLAEDGTEPPPLNLDPADWWSQVEAEFDDVSPEVQFVNVIGATRTFLALLAQTDRIPFVVKSDSPGSPEREVPWRSGTRVRTARRSDLIRLLAPRVVLPHLDILKACLSMSTPRSGNNNWVSDWRLEIEVYAPIQQQLTLTIANHLCSAEFSSGNSLHVDLKNPDIVPWGYHVSLGRIPEGIKLIEHPQRINSATLGVGQITLDGPAGVLLKASTSMPVLPLVLDEGSDRERESSQNEALSSMDEFLEDYDLARGSSEIKVRYTLGIVGADRKISTDVNLHPAGWSDDHKEFEWTWAAPGGGSWGDMW